jgi:hypothetical protein
MTVQALGVDRVHGYPRVVVEPLLWLVVTAGVVWTAVAFDVRAAVSGGVVLQPRLGVISATIAIVLLVNGVAALLFASSPGSVSRALAMLSGLGLVISAWALGRLTEIEPVMRHKLVIGFLVAGVALTLLASVRWRVVPPPPGQVRGWPVLAAMIALGVAAVVLGYMCYRTFDQGFVAVPRRDDAAWAALLPWWMLLVGVLGTMEQVWSQRWLAAALTLVGGALLAAGIAPA